MWTSFYLAGFIGNLWAEEPTEVSTTMTFQSTIQTIPTDIRDKMIGVTWHEGCPIALDELSLLTMSYWGEDNQTHSGQLIIHQTEAKAMVRIFETLYTNQFPLTSMKLMWEFGGSDDASMKANNTSGFNCRRIKNTTKWSNHSYGKAIDVNPLWNPWVRGNIVDPPEGKDYLDRTSNKPGIIKAGDIVVTAFGKEGWKWGGYWKNTKDYQHFSANGR